MCESTASRRPWTALVAIFLVLAWPVSEVGSQEAKTYVGSKACEECHTEEYESFRTYAKKAQSYEKLKIMRKGLTDDEFHGCFECHTTGHGKPGGFRSEEETPELKNAGCEVCHGPGSLHCTTESPGDIVGSLTPEDCERCHRSDRVEAFDYKPMIYGGAH
jgi:hypothetical protein